jgi:hypothetical protein
MNHNAVRIISVTVLPLPFNIKVIHFARSPSAFAGANATIVKHGVVPTLSVQVKAC